jgi:glutamyl-tRNA reductase
VITLQDLDDVVEKMWNQRAEEVASWETLGRLPIPKKTKPKLTDLETEQRVRELLQKLEAQKQKYVGYQNRYVRNKG